MNRNSDTRDGGTTASDGEGLPSAEQDVLELINQGYICALEEGPAWRAACDSGVDMSLIEDALRMSPDARLREHQRALNQILPMVKDRPSDDSRS